MLFPAERSKLGTLRCAVLRAAEYAPNYTGTGKATHVTP